MSEKGTVVGSTPHGIDRVALDGSRHAPLFAAPGLRVEDVTDDFATYALGDDTTSLALGDARTGKMEPLAVAKGRVSAAVFSPDGTTLVVSRHADFSKQGSPDDDTLYVIDVPTHAVREIPSSSDAWPTTLAFSADGTHVFATMAFEKSPQWVELATGKRTATATAPGPLRSSPLRVRSSCPLAVPPRSRDGEVVLSDDAGTTIVVAREEGRKRGFHDYQDDFTEVWATPGCNYVTFVWNGATYVAEAKTGGKLAKLAEISPLLFAPPF